MAGITKITGRRLLIVALIYLAFIRGYYNYSRNKGQSFSDDFVLCLTIHIISKLSVGTCCA